MEEHLEHFKTYGYVVVPIFSEEEVQKIRASFHKTLLSHGIDHDAILSGAVTPPDAIRSKSTVCDIRDEPWKIAAEQDPRIKSLYKFIMDRTFATGVTPGYEHPLGASDKLIHYIDRLCYRLPDHIRSEGGLKLHIDRNPYYPYSGCTKFRPIQSFISLVDHYGHKSGGLQLVPKFHLEYDTYFKALDVSKHIGEPSGGEFYRMHDKTHDKVRSRLETISVPAGAVVLWDNRLPHATCELFESDDSREVLYFAYLPDVLRSVKK